MKEKDEDDEKEPYKWKQGFHTDQIEREIRDDIM